MINSDFQEKDICITSELSFESDLDLSICMCLFNVCMSSKKNILHILLHMHSVNSI